MRKLLNPPEVRKVSDQRVHIRVCELPWDDPGVADDLVSTARAAEALNIARSTLSRWASDGHVTPAQRTIGGHLRWNLDDLRRQVDELTRRE